MNGRKGAMARKLVVLCIGVLMTTAVWGMVVKTVSPTSDLTDVLTFVGGAFGAELMALLCKRLLVKTNNSNEEESS